jgi:GntR family transcriptional regulator
LHLTISQRDGVPLYLQIINQIKQLINSGRLTVDQELLPIRVLAEELLINPNTVARAYRELEAEGWVYKKRGSGTFVSDQKNTLSDELCKRQIKERIEVLLTEAHHMNISTDEVIELILNSPRHKQED